MPSDRPTVHDGWALRPAHIFECQATPTGAVKTQSDCECGQASMERQWSALAKLSPKDDPDKAVQWVCLSDTIDPRGAKGK